ncbi:MAG: hypothetical protein QM765_36230 [Myxococcales bacterium]
MRLLLVTASLLLALGACKKTEAPASSPSAGGVAAPVTPATVAANPRRIPGARNLFSLAKPTVTPSPLPARFGAPLASTEAELGQWQKQPPAPYVAAQLAAGDPSMRERVLEGLRKAATAGPVPEALADHYVRLFGYSPAPASCQWLLATVTGQEPARVRGVLFQALARCSGPGVAEAFTRDDAPDAVIVDWLFDATGPAKTPFHERLARAAAAVAAKGEAYDVRKVGFALSRLQGEKAAGAARKVIDGIADPQRRANASLGLLHHDSPELQALGRKACAHPSLATDPMCSRDEPEAGAGRKKTGTLEDLLSDGAPLSELLAKAPRAEVEAALQRCVKAKASEYGAARCLSQLASLDRAKAVEAAKALPPSRPGDALAEVAVALVKFPEKGALETRLAELGFTAVPGAENEPGEEEPIAVKAVLTRLGRLTSFDTETDRFPNEHDGLMADLATLVRPALDGVAFEEIAPEESRMDDDPYVLRAYLDGSRYELSAANNGDWYDLNAVLGLMNALLAARKSDARLVTLPTGDQTAAVLGGPEKGIRALAEAGLVTAESPSAGMRNGKQFEKQVLEQLRKEHQVIQGGAQGPDLTQP